MTNPTLYYGGQPGLQVGDPLPTELAPRPAEAAARVFTTKALARTWAARYPGGGDVYAVKVQPGPEVRGYRVIANEVPVAAAEVAEVLEREVPRTPEPSSDAHGDPIPDPSVEVETTNPAFFKTAYRAWPICGAPLDGLLTTRLGGGYNFPHWQPGENLAVCDFDHDPPASRCPNGEHCGLAAYDSVEAATREGSAIFAVIRMRGRVAHGGARVLNSKHLLRAERAEITALWISPAIQQQGSQKLQAEPVDPERDHQWAAVLAERYGVPLLDKWMDLDPPRLRGKEVRPPRRHAVRPNY